MISRVNRKNQPLLNLSTKLLLIVLSGPSGAGKDAVLAKMKESGCPLEYITTVTTRPQRANERDNIDYHFISTEMFQKMLENKQLLEWAKVYGNMYGVPKQPVKQALGKGQDVMVKVDIQGAATIKKLLPQAVLIFLTPPSTEDLNLRLKKRHTETTSDLSLRLKTAEEETKQLPIFDYVVVNKQGEIDSAVSDIKAIITAEKCRVNPGEVSL
ncbi:Guanylate kinase [subsurface metagenome]